MKKPFLFAVLSLLVMSLGVSNAAAQAVLPFETSAKQAILVDTTTNTILYEKNADAKMPTSSMSKLMTMVVVFQAIRDGKLSFDQKVKVSEHAWKQEGSRMFVNVGQDVVVSDLVQGVIVQSGNDASVALAEAVAGSEGDFAPIMNEEAAKRGMTHSHFMNATGLPDPEHYSTARDLSVLASSLMREFPEHYHYYSQREFTYNNIKQGNRNPLLYRNLNVDGMKTGHTDDGGYGLIASAIRGGQRLLLVVNGLKDMQDRADESARLLEWGYREYALATPVKMSDVVADAPVWLGKEKKVSVEAEHDLTLTLPRTQISGITKKVDILPNLEAPIIKGQKLGEVTVTIPGKDSIHVALIAKDTVERLGFFAAISAKLHRYFNKGSDKGNS